MLPKETFIIIFCIIIIILANVSYVWSHKDGVIKLNIKSKHTLNKKSKHSLNEKPKYLLNENSNYSLDIKSRKNILIEFDISPSKRKNKGGPYALNKAISQHLPYNVSNCHFVASDSISLMNTKHEADYFFITLPHLQEKDYNDWVKNNQSQKLILGPNFIPQNWNLFPQKNSWKEGRLPEILESVGGIAVHSDRVKNYLAERSNTTSLLQKYIIVRPCTDLRPESVKSFDDRTIDIIFFEKYADEDHSKQGAELFNLLNNSQKKVVSLKYGSYNKEQMMEYAKNSKFIIYFSFFDTGAIGLKEIQNYGVITFTHQKEFVLDESAGYYIPELANKDNMKAAYDKIMDKIEKISMEKPDTELIRKINQDSNRCDRALDDVCDGLQININ